MHLLRVAGTLELQTAGTLPVFPTIVGQPLNDLTQTLRQGVAMTLVLQGLGKQAQVERVTVPGDRIRRAFAQQGNECLFQTAGVLEAFFRGAFDPHMHEGGHGGVVAGNAQLVEQVEGLAQGGRSEARLDHQLIGGDALIGRSADEDLQQIQVLLALHVARHDARQFAFRLGQAFDTQGGREKLHAVFLPPHQSRLFQPGNRGAHPGVVGGDVALEVFFLILGQDFAGSGHNGRLPVLLALQLAQGAQHALNVPPRQARGGRHAVLALHIVGNI